MQATVNNGERAGRGFSLAELKEAGLDARKARRHGIPTDVWRDTKYGDNVEQLKDFVKSTTEAPKKEKKTSEQPPKRKAAKPAKKKKTIKKKQKRKK